MIHIVIIYKNVNTKAFIMPLSIQYPSDRKSIEGHEKNMNVN